MKALSNGDPNVGKVVQWSEVLRPLISLFNGDGPKGKIKNWPTRYPRRYQGIGKVVQWSQV